MRTPVDQVQIEEGAVSFLKVLCKVVGAVDSSPVQVGSIVEFSFGSVGVLSIRVCNILGLISSQ